MKETNTTNLFVRGNPIIRTPLRAVGFNLKDRKAYINWT
ncbi:hypothetical protein LINPERPRIM_LOCUS25690 [Linum perenne]